MISRRHGFTIYEVLIAAAISTILTVVLFNTLLGGQRTAAKNMETLNYLRDASLLMEYIKTDIRNAPKGDFGIEGSNPELMRSIPGGQAVQVRYVYDQSAKVVTRYEQGLNSRSTSFGQGGSSGQGTIVEFMVTKVDNPESPEPFYQVVVAFASPNKQKADDGALKPLKNHRVQALVSRRVPAERADKWNTAFEE